MTREQGTGNREQFLGDFTFGYLCWGFSVHLLTYYLLMKLPITDCSFTLA
ncbi:MAG: hypothetical protein ACK57R_18490 [Dolichospermum sp.]